MVTKTLDDKEGHLGAEYTRKNMLLRESEQPRKADKLEKEIDTLQSKLAKSQEGLNALDIQKQRAQKIGGLDKTTNKRLGELQQQLTERGSKLKE